MLDLPESSLNSESWHGHFPAGAFLMDMHVPINPIVLRAFDTLLGEEVTPSLSVSGDGSLWLTGSSATSGLPWLYRSDDHGAHWRFVTLPVAGL